MAKAAFFLSLLPLGLLLAPAAAHAAPKPRCAVGDICELTFPLFGCKDDKPLRQWVELFVNGSAQKAETYLDQQEDAGNCVRFHKGERLRIVRYIGLSRLEAERPDETQRWLMPLK
jgi:hypothetical protein